MRKSAKRVAETARSERLSPTAMPIPAVTHIKAAVVNPDTPCFERKIVPAPMKPIPGMICAAIREGSPIPNSDKLCHDSMANRQLPMLISEKVRMLGSLPAISRSIPMSTPSTAESNRGPLNGF